jgi:hypothetical protein
MRFPHRIDEQRPPILQVGDHHHADDTRDQLPPTRHRGRLGVIGRRSRNCHGYLPWNIGRLWRQRAIALEARWSLRHYQYPINHNFADVESTRQFDAGGRIEKSHVATRQEIGSTKSVCALGGWLLSLKTRTSARIRLFPPIH